MENTTFMLWGNIITAASYYILTGQLLYVVRNPKFVSLFQNVSVRSAGGEQKTNQLFYLFIAVAVLFASFICMCGNTHTMNVIRHYNPHSSGVYDVQTAIMVTCALVSVLTAIAGFKMFPVILEILESFELGEDGRLQHTESYLIEAVNMIKESIMVLSENLIVLKGNEASKFLFGPQSAGTKIVDYIHPSDLPMFHATVTRVMGSYNFTPATIEMRVRKEPSLVIFNTCAPGTTYFNGTAARTRATPPASPVNPHRGSNGSNGSHGGRVHCADDSAGHQSVASGGSSPSHRSANATLPRSRSATTSSVSNEDDYFLWVEVTLCKGARVGPNSDFIYDLKMAARNIDDRKKRALYQSIIEGTEEKGRINESKLRYISCIAHDLKTPLQSFCFTLDLLRQTRLHPEQKDYLEQANIAVDLMKLTISQTMDISKALTGAKLLPRRTTVYLSSVMQRVKVIINGYGKQVPVSFEVTPDVCDAIITDEEWLWQMLLNLLTNACKYTDKGSIAVKLSLINGTEPDLVPVETERLTLLPRLSLPAIDASEMLLCEVIDTGIGISPEKMAHLFDAFSQVQEGQTTGTGLGLFGVRTRAEGLSGSCGARSNTSSSTGSGTVLWFTIPYVPDSSYSPCLSAKGTMETSSSGGPLSTPAPYRTISLSPTAPSEAKALAPLATVSTETKSSEPFSVPQEDEAANRVEEFIRMRKLTAIVVEDTLTVLKLMEKLLKRMGFARVDCYENGSKGLDAMMAGQVDIVFSDVQMPIMTGPEMVNRFRKHEADLLFSGARTERQAVVAVTANGDQGGLVGEHGFDEVYLKPLNRSDIYHAVNKYLRGTAE